MFRATLSELSRLQRKSFLLGWVGISALFVTMISTFTFKAAADGTTLPSSAPGVSFPTAAALVQPDGIVSGLGSAATLLGVVTLAFWAIATATDYSTGLVRLLVQAQPNRPRLLGGKILALTGWTAAVTTVVTVVAVALAPLMARATGISTSAWTTGIVGNVAGAWLNTFLALMVWGVIGLVIAVLTRSSAVAIAVGVGYVLVFEAVVRLASARLADWLPGSTLNALAHGGTAAVAYGTAVALGLAYASFGLVTAAVTFKRRDILD